MTSRRLLAEKQSYRCPLIRLKHQANLLCLLKNVPLHYSTNSEIGFSIRNKSISY
jgi:hypothetical protein